MILPETGEYLSEDYAFCHRWRAIGGRIWLDTESRLTHIGSYEYHGDTAARFAVAQAGRANAASRPGTFPAPHGPAHRKAESQLAIWNGQRPSRKCRRAAEWSPSAG